MQAERGILVCCLLLRLAIAIFCKAVEKAICRQQGTLFIGWSQDLQEAS
jgi:hypothetical protein